MKSRKSLVASLAASVAAAVWVAAAAAQPAPLSTEASPDVYKVAAENSTHRLIEGTWKPGQRDKAHRHPAYIFYWVTACTLRFHTPDGARDMTFMPGRSGAAPAVATHEVENVGTSDCKVLMFEPQ